MLNARKLGMTHFLILAAGQGKRMHSDLPKVLHTMGGVTLIEQVIRTVIRAVPGAQIGVVVGHGAEKVKSALLATFENSQIDLSFIDQKEQKGTGHAVLCSVDSDWGKSAFHSNSRVVVLPGDLPLITQNLVVQLSESLSRTDVVRLLTCDLVDPTGYGRVVRKGKAGKVLRIVEQKDASEREKLISEVATSIYCFQASFLKAMLPRLNNKNAQKEYYLTDLIEFASLGKKGIQVLKWKHPEDLKGINDAWELAQARVIFNQRKIEALAKAGVRFADYRTALIDETVQVGADTELGASVVLRGETKIGDRVWIGNGVELIDVQVEDEVIIKKGTVAESSVIKRAATLGPYAHLRPDSIVGEESKVGNFVELKKSKIGKKTSVAHLSYLGDAEVGDRVNIGCGFVTCNFDGRVIDGSRKHKTLIGDDVFMGSDCQVVAPIEIGSGAYIASGSTITENVAKESLAIARSRQVNKLDYAKKLRK